MVILLIFAIFVAGINADCVPAPVKHTETGDDLYKGLLGDLADAEIQAATIVKQAQAVGCVSFDSLDFFTQLLVTIVGDNYWLERLTNGTITPSGSECVAENLRIDFDLKNIAAKANVAIPGPSCDQLTGAAKSQYVLQKYGQALIALAAAPNGGGSGTGGSTGTVGKWQKYVQDLNNGIANVRTIITNNDEANCLTTTKTLANGLKGILESRGLTTLVI